MKKGLIFERLTSVGTNPSKSYEESSRLFDLNDPNNIELIDTINISKFPILLIFCKPLKTHYIIKLYPYYSGKINPAYLNESRFKSLEHNNISLALIVTTNVTKVYKLLLLSQFEITKNCL